MSRRYTLTRRSAMANAAQRTNSTRMASTRAGRYSTSGARWNTTIAPASTSIWRKKCTIAAPIEASGRISRGNHTFCTSWALPTIEPVPAETAVEKRFQASRPERKKMA